MFTRVALCLGTLLTALCALRGPIQASTASGRIGGVLKDPSGAVIQGGRIALTSLD